MAKKSIEWDMDMKILSNKVVMRQIYMAFGIPCAFLFVFVTILNLSDGVSSFSEYFTSILPILYIIIGFIVIPIPIILIFFRNKYPVTFTLDDKTAMMQTRKKQRERNKFVSNLLIFLGIFAGKPTAVGTGMINRNNNDMAVRFSMVKTVKHSEKDRTIFLKVNPFEKVYLFCNETNYKEVLDFIKNKVKKNTQFVSK